MGIAKGDAGKVERALRTLQECHRRAIDSGVMQYMVVTVELRDGGGSGDEAAAWRESTVWGVHERLGGSLLLQDQWIRLDRISGERFDRFCLERGIERRHLPDEKSGEFFVIRTERQWRWLLEYDERVRRGELYGYFHPEKPVGEHSSQERLRFACGGPTEDIVFLFSGVDESAAAVLEDALDGALRQQGRDYVWHISQGRLGFPKEAARGSES